MKRESFWEQRAKKMLKIRKRNEKAIGAWMHALSVSFLKGPLQLVAQCIIRIIFNIYRWRKRDSVTITAWIIAVMEWVAGRSFHCWWDCDCPRLSAAGSATYGALQDWYTPQQQDIANKHSGSWKSLLNHIHYIPT